MKDLTVCFEYQLAEHLRIDICKETIRYARHLHHSKWTKVPHKNAQYVTLGYKMNKWVHHFDSKNVLTSILSDYSHISPKDPSEE